MASKRVARWSVPDREWLESLKPAERDCVLMLVAHLDASPYSEGS